MPRSYYPNFPSPGSEESSFSDPELPSSTPVINWDFCSTRPRTTSFAITETNRDCTTIPRNVYPPPAPHPRSQPNPMGVRPPRRIVTREALEERLMQDERAKKAERVLFRKIVLGLLAVLVAVLSWVAFAGSEWDVKDHLYRFPGMGPCLRFEERVKDTLKWWGDKVEEPKRVGTKRGMLLEGHEDFGSLVWGLRGSMVVVEEVVQGLRDGREEMTNMLEQVTGYRVDPFKVLAGQFEDGVEKGVDAIYQHKVDVEKVLDQSYRIFSDKIERLETLQRDGPGSLCKWCGRIFGNHNEQYVMQQEIDGEVRTLTGFLDLWIMSGVEDAEQELPAVIDLRLTFEKIALLFTKGKPEENRFEDAGYWKDVLNSYYEQQVPPNIEGIGAGLADTWIAVEDARFLVEDNLGRLNGLIKSLDELKAGPKREYTEDVNAFGDYIDHLMHIWARMRKT